MNNLINKKNFDKYDFFSYIIIIIVSLYLGHYIAYGWVLNNIFVTYTGATLLILSTYLTMMLSISITTPFNLVVFLKFFTALATAWLFSSAFYYYLSGYRFAPRALLYSTIIIFVLSYFYKIFLYFFTTKSLTNIMIIGTGKEARFLSEEIGKYDKIYSFKGFIDYEKSNYEDLDPKKIHRNIDKIEDVVKKNNVDLIVLTDELKEDDELLKNVVDMKLLGYNVTYLANFYETLTGKVPIKYINNNWFINSDFYAIYNKSYLVIKRVQDILFSLIGLLLSSPILILVSIIIKIEDGGSIFFLQNRVGFGGKIFKIIKFRTMKVGSEKGNKYTQKNDTRITKIGEFLRKTRIDEIPQFINVLKGEMSVIGPRAEWDELVDEYKKEINYYHIRSLVRPGITGWAQVEYRYGANLNDTFEKLQYDLFYIKHQSLILDLSIIFKTIKVVFKLAGR
jgi:exopolysaccharide biosynthesis polyprenyl glycosylphosphotransferase